MDVQTPPSMKTTTLVAIKRGLLLYWSLWCTLVFVTHVLLLLKALGWVGLGEFPLISSSRAIYGVPAGEKGTWRLGVIAWEGAATVAFWVAFRRFRGRRTLHAGALAAPFIVAFILFATFVITDRLFLNTSYEATHLRILAGLAASSLVVCFLPE